MKCPRCQHKNETGAKFCEECAAPLARACAKCGRHLSPTAKFCPECAHPTGQPTAPPPSPRFGSPTAYTPRHLADKILTSRTALEGERKLVTVLFVDVANFTGLAEKLDPEDVHDLMDRAFELMLAEIHRYEGTINQFLGDGVMALFGAPIAHEDHAVRALHAALGVRRALRQYGATLRAERELEFRARMGLNTGTVVVAAIGDDLRMDYTALGDTTNLAARLLGLAAPDQILVGESTARAARPYFALEPIGEVSVKGKREPVHAWLVEGARAARGRLEAALERGLTPLIGRERELALLRERFADVERGHGQVVFVTGDAGIGKSRLLLEFRQHVGERTRWLIGRCVSYGRAVSYVPVLDVVRDLLALDEADDPVAMGAKIERGIHGLDEGLAWAVPLVRALLSLDPADATVAEMNPHQRRSRIVDALRALVAAASTSQPMVLLVEDLHWVDAQSEEVVRRLLEGIATLPVLVILTHRPGYSQPFGDHTYFTRLALQALPPAQTGALVGAVLGATSALPTEVIELIERKAEGNPLFVEELSRALVEDGTLERVDGGYRLGRSLAGIVIPDTIQGVIMARVDRLPETSKTALQVASVIGREFSARLVERVAAVGRDVVDALGPVRDVELIYETSVHPELAYMFKHALTHDVAYESLLRQRRRELHRRAGEVIEVLYADRLAEFHETLAHHFVQGEVWAKAARYLIAAGAKSRAHYAYRQGAAFLAEAIDICERQAADRGEHVAALEALGDVESLLAEVDAANRAYGRALELADDRVVRARITNKQHCPGEVRRNGARIAYYEHGIGEPTLVLMHPLFYGLGTYQPLLEQLCQEFRIITIDPRGTGRSDPIPEAYSLREHVEDARTVIEAICDRPVVLVGISRAGSHVLRFAALYPHLVERIVVFGAASRPPAVPRPWREELLAHVEAGDYETASRIFWPTVVSEPGGRDLAETYIELSRRLPAEVFRSFFLLQDPDMDLQPVLPHIRIPTLVVQPDEDQITPLERGRELAASIPGAELYVMKGRGHAAYNTATAEFAQAVRSFVRR